MKPPFDTITLETKEEPYRFVRMVSYDFRANPEMYQEFYSIFPTPSPTREDTRHTCRVFSINQMQLYCNPIVGNKEHCEISVLPGLDAVVAISDLRSLMACHITLAEMLRRSLVLIVYAVTVVNKDAICNFIDKHIKRYLTCNGTMETNVLEAYD